MMKLGVLGFLLLGSVPVFSASLEELCTVKSAKNFSNDELISKIQSMLQCQNGIGATLKESREMPFYASVPESLKVLSAEFQNRISSGKLSPKARHVADAKGILEGVKKDLARLGVSGTSSPSGKTDSEKQKIWTPLSFEQTCQSAGGQNQKKPDTDRVYLVCVKNGSEIRSAWFSNSSLQMMGSLEHYRNEKNQLVKDVEFDSAGKLLETYFYLPIPAELSASPRSQVVFDRDTQLERGNIFVGKENYVITSPQLILNHGAPSTLGEVQKTLSREFQVPATTSFYDQLSQIWLKQNSSAFQLVPSTKAGSK